MDALRGLVLDRWPVVMIPAGFALLIVSLTVPFEGMSNGGFASLGGAAFFYGLGWMAGRRKQIEFRPCPGGQLKITRHLFALNGAALVLWIIAGSLALLAVALFIIFAIRH